jgi:hypothetical protein
LGKLWLDSLEEDDEDVEAHLQVPPARRGAACSGGAMAGTVVAVGFPPVSLLTEKRREKSVEGGRWRRRERGRRLGFLGPRGGD